MKQILIGAVLLASLPAYAQQQPPRPPMEQALSERLGIEINANVQATAVIIDLQRQLAAAQAKIKEHDETAASKEAQPPKNR